MSTNAREFIDFWVEASVHAAEQFGVPGAEQAAAELARRCLDMAAEQGLSEADLETEIGEDLTVFIENKLRIANDSEKARGGRRPR
jgi:hypothetical protein